MALTGEELTALISLAEDSQDDRDSAYSLESLADSFLSKISPDSLFRVLSGLVCLLEADLLSAPSRLAALAVLSESKQEPFVNAVRLLEKQNHNAEEQKFVRHLLNGNREYIRQSGVSLLKQQLPEAPKPPLQKDKIDERTLLQRSAISAIIPDPEQFKSSNDDDETLRRNSMHMILSEPNFGKRILQPQFISIPPPLYEGPDDELEWLFPAEPYLHDIEWDSSMCQNGIGRHELEKLFKIALSRKLEVEEENRFKEEIKQDPKMLESIGLNAEALPQLVEFNPMVTVEVLMIILKYEDKEEIKKYLRQMTNIAVTLQSLEVVNRLVTQVELPADFIPYYITRCTQTCELLEDRSQQGRLVRLVCVFLRALINNSLFDIKSMLSEVQAFCVEFARIREAAGLFRLLKQMDNEKSNDNHDQSQ